MDIFPPQSSTKKKFMLDLWFHCNFICTYYTLDLLVKLFGIQKTKLDLPLTQLLTFTQIRNLEDLLVKLFGFKNKARLPLTQLLIFTQIRNLEDLIVKLFGFKNKARFATNPINHNHPIQELRRSPCTIAWVQKQKLDCH
jgi:hypothetical protein